MTRQWRPYGTQEAAMRARAADPYLAIAADTAWDTDQRIAILYLATTSALVLGEDPAYLTARLPGTSAEARQLIDSRDIYDPYPGDYAYTRMEWSDRCGENADNLLESADWAITHARMQLAPDSHVRRRRILSSCIWSSTNREIPYLTSDDMVSEERDVVDRTWARLSPNSGLPLLLATMSRRAQPLTREQLAEQVGVPASTVRGWMTEAATPDASQCRALDIALGERPGTTASALADQVNGEPWGPAKRRRTDGRDHPRDD